MSAIAAASDRLLAQDTNATSAGVLSSTKKEEDDEAVTERNTGRHNGVAAAWHLSRSEVEDLFAPSDNSDDSEEAEEGEVLERNNQEEKVKVEHQERVARKKEEAASDSTNPPQAQHAETREPEEPKKEEPSSPEQKPFAAREDQQETVQESSGEPPLPEDHDDDDRVEGEHEKVQEASLSTNLNWKDGEEDFPFDMYEPCTLHELIRNHDVVDGQPCFDKAIQRVLQGGVVRPLDHNNTELQPINEVGFQDDSGQLPLHLALQCHMEASPQLIKVLLERGPEFCKIPHSFSNDLPLHMACHPMDRQEKDKKRVVANGSREHQVIQLVLKAYPEAVWKLDDERATPLHVLLQHRPDLQVVQELLTSAEQHKPSDAPDYSSILQICDGTGQLPLHVAIQHYAPAEAIMHLLTRCPRATECLGDVGMLPLHTAAMVGCATKELLENLVDHNPMGVEKQNVGTRNTPLHILLHPEDSLVRWFSLNEIEGSSGIEHGLIHSEPTDLLKPSEMIKIILDRYYRHFESCYKQGYDANKKEKKKRKRGGSLANAPMKKVQKLLKVKNHAGYTILAQAKTCLQQFGDNNAPKELVDTYVHLTKIEKGVNVFDDSSEEYEI